MDELSNFEQLINGNSTSLTESDITSLMSQMMIWFMVPLILISIVFLILFILHNIRRRKLENAILEIRDILRDMNLANQLQPQSSAEALSKEAFVESVSQEPPDDVRLSDA